MKKKGIIWLVLTILLALDIGAGYFLAVTGAKQSAVNIAIGVGVVLGWFWLCAGLEYCILSTIRDWKKVLNEPPKK